MPSFKTYSVILAFGTFAMITSYHYVYIKTISARIDKDIRKTNQLGLVPLHIESLNETDRVNNVAEMIVFVMTRRGSAKTRDTIRETWARGRNNVLFVIGKPCHIPIKKRHHWTCIQKSTLNLTEQAEWEKEVNATESALEMEQSRFGDILRVNEIDVHLHSPHKLKVAYAWGVEKTKAKWIVKTDDDMIVRVDTLAKLLTTQYNATKPTVIGHIVQNKRISRSGNWMTSNYTKTRYPPWPQGSFVVSRPVAEYVVQHRDELFNYQGEDVSLGIWLDESPLKHHIMWRSTKAFTNDGDCMNKKLMVIGHGFDSKKMEKCIIGMYEAPGMPSHGDISRVLNQTMTEGNQQLSFRKKFLLWDQYLTPDIGPEVRPDDQHFLIYRCDSSRMSTCGGWADRLMGVMAAYVMANLTGRTFKAEILNLQCDLTNYLVPNKVNWSLPTPSVFPNNDSEFRILRHVDDSGFKNRMKSANLSAIFEQQYRYIYFLANLDNLSGISKSKQYARQLAWMQGLSPADIYAAVYKHLFKIAPRLRVKLQRVLSKALPTPKHRLVCIHVRMGRNPSIPDDSEVRNSMNNLPNIWEFVKKRSTTKYDKVFVMSDSAEVIQSAKQQTFKDRLVTIPGGIVHVDKTRRLDVSTSDICESIDKLIIEHHMLMNCDVLIRGHSGLSDLASAIRGSDNDLYCLKDDGHIRQCPRNDDWSGGTFLR